MVPVDTMTGVLGMVPVEIMTGVLGMVPVDFIVGVLGMVPVDLLFLVGECRPIIPSCSCPRIVSIKP